MKTAEDIVEYIKRRRAEIAKIVRDDDEQETYLQGCSEELERLLQAIDVQR